MKIYKISQSELILPAGSVLYHGTVEEFDYSNPRGGGYDSVFWTTDDPKIAQTYIPVSGLLMTSVNHIYKPSTNPTIISIQKAIGIDYNQSTFKFDHSYNPDSPSSYKMAPIFEDKKYWHGTRVLDEKPRCQYVIDKLREVFGYEKVNRDNSPCYAQFRIKTHGYEPQHADYRTQGILLTVTTQRNFKIFDMTYGGQNDGSLIEPDYNKIQSFRQTESSGYDGVKINDFAQSNNYGNYGHTSIGLFPIALKDISIQTNVAHHEDL